ncbi:MAG: Holliday junction DNA helicase RuvA [Desulfobacterales bacterium]|nr:Holliday junction DNA helicase RuvA [Desulfobacterales bacterium]
MIGYMEGKLLNKGTDRILLLANQIGYEVLLPAFVMDTMSSKTAGDEVSFYIYFHQTERQPKPVLIGFNLEAEKEFFLHFISVEGIGPLKAVNALTIPISDIAGAIEIKDEAKIKKLKGIGARTAQKIIATLTGKMNKFALIRKEAKAEMPVETDVTEQVLDALVNQLGHKTSDARQMITDAMTRKPEISSPEELFDEVYRGAKTI